MKVSTDFGTLTNLATLPDAEPNATTQIRVQLSASEMNGDVVHIEFIDQTAAKEWADYACTILTTA